MAYDETEFVTDLDQVLKNIRDLLVFKNKAYGNSVLEPKMIFSKLSAAERIKVRLDDKASRLAGGGADDGEDTVKDMLGYLILEQVYLLRQERKKKEEEEKQLFRQLYGKGVPFEL